MSGCCVRGCNSKHGKSTRYFYLLPKKKSLFDVWTRLIDRQDIPEGNPDNLRVCIAHFEPTAFTCTKKPPFKRTMLTKSVPTLRLPGNPRLTQEHEDQTDRTRQSKPCVESEIDERDTEFLELENEIASIYSGFYKTISNNNKETVPFFTEKFNKWKGILMKKYGKHTYLQKLKLLCLNLYCSAPKAYKLFAKCLSLPSVRSLQNTKFIFTSGINEEIIMLLKKQSNNMSKKAKYVTLCVDEIPLHKNLYYDIRNDEVVGFHIVNGIRLLEMSEYCLIFRLKGLLCDYEQVISYGLNGGYPDYPGIKSWLHETIALLHKNGFVVCAIVSNQNANMNQLALSYGVTIENPFVMVGGKKIFYLFDVPQTMNVIRDNLLECDLLYDDCKMASWQYVKSFYEKDCDRKARLAPKLSFAHIKPTGRQRTKEKLMKQVFSYTTAAGISADVDNGHQPPEAAGTAEFLLMMNNLYDLLDTTRVKNNRNKYKNTFTGKKYQIDYLLNAYRIFQDIRAFSTRTGKDRTDEINCFLAMQISIKAILQLKEYFSDIKSLFTKRLHLNSCKLLSDIKKHHRGKPEKKLLTPIEIRRCFSNLVIKDLMKNSYLTNCNNDLDSVIFGKESEENDFTILGRYFAKAPNTSPVAVNTTDYRFYMPSVGSFKLVCSYLLYKCSTIHDCDTFKSYFARNKKLISKDQVDSVVKKFALNFVVPPRDFFNYIHSCEIFINLFFNNPSIVEKNVGANLLKYLKLQKIKPLKPCPCFPLDYLNKLFFRLRIYNNIKFRNYNINRLQSQIPISNISAV